MTLQTKTIDQAKVEEFVGRVLVDTAGAMTTTLAAVGDRLGLFKDLAQVGPATSEEFARRTGINGRYAREWLGAMTAAGYIQYNAPDGRFSLPPEHAPALVQEGGPVFFGGVFQMFPHLVRPLDHLTQAFRDGGGVPQAEYDPAFWAGMERFTAGWFENYLLQEWIPAMPNVQSSLERGALVADVGCGSGRAVIKLAQAFPNSRFVGYDLHQEQLDRAQANVREAGLADRVSVRTADVVGGLPEQYDVITTFDVVHDAVNPRGLLRAIRQALRPDGRYVCLDINCSDRLEENIGPLGAMFHGFSLLYCLTTSLADHGEGLGTLGFHERAVRELCKEAGFSDVRRVPLENPFNVLYEIAP